VEDEEDTRHYMWPLFEKDRKNIPPPPPQALTLLEDENNEAFSSVDGLCDVLHERKVKTQELHRRSTQVWEKQLKPALEAWGQPTLTEARHSGTNDIYNDDERCQNAARAERDSQSGCNNAHAHVLTRDRVRKLLEETKGTREAYLDDYHEILSGCTRRCENTVERFLHQSLNQRASVAKTPTEKGNSGCNKHGSSEARMILQMPELEIVVCKKSDGETKTTTNSLMTQHPRNDKTHSSHVVTQFSPECLGKVLPQFQRTLALKNDSRLVQVLSRLGIMETPEQWQSLLRDGVVLIHDDSHEWIENNENDDDDISMNWRTRIPALVLCHVAHKLDAGFQLRVRLYILTHCTNASECRIKCGAPRCEVNRVLQEGRRIAAAAYGTLTTHDEAFECQFVLDMVRCIVEVSTPSAMVDVLRVLRTMSIEAHGAQLVRVHN